MDGARAQMSLPLNGRGAFDRMNFIQSDRNRRAVEALESWPEWPGGRLTLVGPEGSGKTHLASIWALRTGAIRVEKVGADLARLPNGPLLLEDADRGVADELLFHLINRAGADGGLLLTARTPPRDWPATLPDLRSRLNALLAVDIGSPDDAVLEGLLRNLFRERHIRPDPDLLPYLLRRMERTAPAARALVDRLDEAAYAAGRGVTRALARELLEAGEASGDLFE